MSIGRNVKIKYLGHSTFLFTTPSGRRLLIDPWVENNPACPSDSKELSGLDTLLITHAHPDHMEDGVSLSKKFEPQVVCNFEISLWLGDHEVENVVAMNKGGTVALEELKVTMVNAHHSSGLVDDGKVIYGGEPAGYVVEFENGFRIYHAGDTCLFGDMELIADLYKPELLFLPIGDHFTMGPVEAAHACRLMKAEKVIPMHYATFPVLTGTTDKFSAALSDLGLSTEVIAMEPGQEIS